MCKRFFIRQNQTLLFN